MRDYLLFGVVFILLWRTFQSPMIGVLTFTWLSLMNPHRLTYGAAYDFPFAAIVVVVTLIALVFSKDKWRLSMTPVTVTLILFMVWMTATSFVALEPDLVWTEWNRVMKTLFMTLITIIVIKSKKDIIALAWVVGLSVAFYGLKGGIFTLVSGGNYHVYGPDGSYIADNNALALAFIAILPIVRFLQLQATKGWMRLGMGGVAILTAISAAGSYSRGALVAAAAMFFFLWIKSKQKFKTGIALVLVATIVFMVMPGEWFARMQTIDDYKTDDSSLGRINAWYFALNVAKQNFMGGGFSIFTPKMFFIYAPDPRNHHAAHSIYFQVLGEHGYIGLIFFILLLIFSWRTGTRILAFCKGKEGLKWASDLAAMCQVSMVGFAVGGGFLALAYYDLYYFVVALLVGLEKLLLLPTRQEAKNKGLPIVATDIGRNGEVLADEKNV